MMDYLHICFQIRSVAPGYFCNLSQDHRDTTEYYIIYSNRDLCQAQGPLLIS